MKIGPYYRSFSFEGKADGLVFLLGIGRDIYRLTAGESVKGFLAAPDTRPGRIPACSTYALAVAGYLRNLESCEITLSNNTVPAGVTKCVVEAT